VSLPQLPLHHIDPQPRYHHVGTLDHDTVLMSEVVLTPYPERPGFGYLSIILDDDKIRAQRLLYVPWTRDFTNGLRTSANPLGDILAEVRRSGQDVIISQWLTDENGSPTVFYIVSAADLLRAYHP
jgi:hypothetical protein